MKRGHHNPRVADLNACARVVAASRPYTAEKAAEIGNLVRIAAQLLRDGIGTAADFNRVCWAFNVASVRAQEIDPELLAVMGRGAQAMVDCECIRGQHGNYGFTFAAWADLADALDLHDEILRASTPNQMTAAQATAERLQRERMTA